MKTKKKNMPRVIDSLVEGMKNNEFRAVPIEKMDQLSGIFPDSQRHLLDSSIYGLSANCFFAISNRIDPSDDPMLINTEILVCNYDFGTASACVTGMLIYRGGSWHHSEPAELVTTSLSYDNIGVMKEVLEVCGNELDEKVKDCIGDAYGKLRKS